MLSQEFPTDVRFTVDVLSDSTASVFSIIISELYRKAVRNISHYRKILQNIFFDFEYNLGCGFLYYKYMLLSNRDRIRYY